MADGAADLAAVLADVEQSLRVEYQPIVGLDDGSVVAVEALARGPAGTVLEAPRALFGVAGAAGRLAELDLACHRAALRGLPPADRRVTLFVNVEAETLAASPRDWASTLAPDVPASVALVVEVTERSLLDRPAELLAGVRDARRRGWRIALDDVGAERAALALMAFLRPEVIKLDLSLVQQRATLDAAEIINAVNAQAQRTGAVVLAEGVETRDQAAYAAAMGARLGQGYYFGRPAAAVPAGHRGPLALPRPVVDPAPPARTPFELLGRGCEVQRTTRPLLEARTRELERQALVLDDLTVVLVSFEHARQVSESTRRRFAALARASGLVGMVGPGMRPEPAPGVRGTAVAADDPLADEWAITVVAPHFAAALAARRLHGDGEELFDYVMTYDRDQALMAATSLMTRLRSAPPTASRVDPPRSPASVPLQAGPRLGVSPAELPELLLRAIGTATNGIVIVDAQAADLPLVYVNDAFLTLTGYAEGEVLGRNCRFLQGPDTDPAAVRPIARRLAGGREVASVLLNYRKDGTPFWNEIRISPVSDAAGRLTHFIGNQVDVSDRVRRDEAVAYLAYHDPLTGLPNRAHVLEQLDLEIHRARRAHRSLVVLFVDLDGFKEVNDEHGHAAGDDVLAAVAARLRRRIRAGDVIARHGGDEFLVVLTEVDPGAHADAVQRVAAELLGELAIPVACGDAAVHLSASIGAAVYPNHGETSEELIRRADAAMYRGKQDGGRRVELFGSEELRRGAGAPTTRPADSQVSRGL